MEKIPVIGIVGGVGPYAGLALNRLIFDNTLTDGTDQDHLEVILFSAGRRVTDRTEFLLGREPINPSDGIFEACCALAAAGATVAAIACNTAHAPEILDPLRQRLEQENIALELVDMIGETARFITDNYGSGTRVGLLATEGTVRAGVYNRLELESNGSHDIILPDNGFQDQVHRAIYDTGYGIKARSNPVTDRAVEACREAALHLARQGAGVVILGCTELPLALVPGSVPGLDLVDPASVTARALISRVAPEKLKPLGAC
ncbi:MAG: amino acid racemase [Gemmatimonadota bacterium]|nr:amino acid racemase [Gemmatimonadota bacterium]